MKVKNNNNIKIILNYNEARLLKSVLYIIQFTKLEDGEITPSQEKTICELRQMLNNIL